MTFRRGIAVAALATVAAFPAAPAAAAPEDCLTVIGGTTVVDVAVCLVAEMLPPDAGAALRDAYRQVPGCLTGHLDGCDTTVCPVLAAYAPGVPGVVDIAPDGDVAVAGSSVWDCPPYASA